MNQTMIRGHALVWGPEQRNRESGWAAGVYMSVCNTHNVSGTILPRMPFLRHTERGPCQAKRELSQCSPGTKDLHTVSYKKPFRWGSSGSLSSRTFTGMNELQYIILSFPGMKKWWAGVGSIIKKKWKSPFVFYTSPRGPPFIRNRLDFLELPQASVAFTAGLHCTPSSRQPHSVPAFIERPSRLQKTHRCLIQMRRVAFWIMLRLPDNNHSSTWKQNACVSLWSLHRFLDLRLHREYHKFTCYLWKTDTALASLIYLKRGVRREKKKEKNNIFM